MNERDFRYAQRQLNITAVLYALAGAALFGWFIWSIV